MAARVGLFLSGLAILIACIWSAYLLVVASEWWLVILIYLGVYIVAALAVIWLGVLVVHVIAKGIRVTDETRRIR